MMELKKTPFLSTLTAMLACCWISGTQAEQAGQAAFNQICAACHTIGSGDLVGPDLSGVVDRRSEDWLLSFISSSTAVIQSGDAQANAVFEKYHRIPMPDVPLSETEIRSVLDYIRSKGATPSDGAVPVAATQTGTAPVDFTDDDVNIGQHLYQGTIRFANGGPACNACHEVSNDAVIGGGILARELTSVFSKLGGTGVRAILGSPPFPVMQAAYEDKPLEKQEIHALIAFLRRADSEHLYQQPRDYGVGLLISGLTGTAVLYLLFSMLWFRRKKGPVNQVIFDRQVRSMADRQDLPLQQG